MKSPERPLEKYQRAQIHAMSGKLGVWEFRN